MPEALERLNALAAESLAQVMETMAFVCAEPVTGDAKSEQPSGTLVCLTMSFTGPIAGSVEMVAPEKLGEMLGLNMVASELVAGCQRMQRDALLELLNMTCGLLFSKATEGSSASFDIAIPRLKTCDGANAWADFVARPGVTVLDAEGVYVAIRVLEASSCGVR